MRTAVARLGAVAMCLGACAGSEKSTAVPVAPTVPIDPRVPEAQPDFEELMRLPDLWRSEIQRSAFKVTMGDVAGNGNFDNLFGALSLGAPRNPFLAVEMGGDGRPILVERRPGAEGKKILDAADKAFSAGKLDEALEGYKRVVELEPLWPKPRFYVAAALKQKKDYEGADNWIEQGLRLGARDAFAYALRAEMLADRGSDRVARETLARALALDPYSPPALKLLERLGAPRKPGMRPRIEIDKGVGRDLRANGSHPAWKLYAACRALLIYDGKVRDEYLQRMPPGKRSPLEETTCGFLAVAAYRESRTAGAPEDTDLDRWGRAYDVGLLREAVIYETLGCRHPEALQLLDAQPEQLLRMVEYTRLFVVPREAGASRPDAQPAK